LALITGSSRNITIGVVNCNLAYASANGTWVTNALTGDLILRSLAANTLHLTSGSGTSVMSITTASVTIRQPLTLTTALSTANGYVLYTNRRGTGLTTVGNFVRSLRPSLLRNHN
jgi:hypothetical protein